MRDQTRSKPLRRRVLAVLLVAVVVAGLAVAVANVVTVAATRERVVTVDGAASALAADPADAVVVLGASVYPDGTPSDILADRLEVACDLYKAGAARAIIVSGDNRTSHYNESDAMKAYCVTLGVPSEDVYVDHAGNTTYESMWRARHVFGAERIIVATQAYHLYRAMFAADCLGMDTWGVACDKGAYDNQQRYSIREVLARTKDFYAALLRLPVATSGEAVSLDASGDLT
ncbi:ElyC/SanA/YdcF family protein [Adlercreutzia sp. R25]|uniref:ElyC/SanA/YdcF family protein n=1 Tax=Adlercreutzia shanghongiae TaxID=3111773 RepID=A0ABU6IZT3_9ACTN|nr:MULTISPECIES: ElyC/SanA/YdcF family protein [unclassified Adlercreutzia]MEC4273116.1 ElyC/SanA/YdcF family protein [Adlercreutzia sp. R25]MEC4295399.1 ElyC/SanA/YdcF family protein [Adlercreutzia sp. R22]